MKKICLFLLYCLLFTVYCLSRLSAEDPRFPPGLLIPVYAQTSPHLELSPASGIITGGGTSIGINIDTGGQAAKSAKAVINFDSSLLEVSSIQASDFFDDVSHNIYNSSGQVVVNANLSLGSMLESKTGTGTLATMTVRAKASSGTATMVFDCTEGSSTDSNINDPTPLDIIVCSANVNGSYSLSGGQATPSATPVSSPGIGGNGSATPAAVPVTGVSGPTIGLFLAGLFLIFSPLLARIKLNG